VIIKVTAVHTDPKNKYHHLHRQNNPHKHPHHSLWAGFRQNVPTEPPSIHIS
jgi:hypothetical protein